MRCHGGSACTPFWENQHVPGGPSAGPDPRIPVSAQKLAEAYAADKKAPDANYQGKYLLVDGEVVSKDIRPTHTLYLKGDGNLRIACYVEEKEYEGIQPGQRVKVVGSCEGTALLVTDVLLFGGHLVP